LPTSSATVLIPNAYSRAPNSTNTFAVGFNFRVPTGVDYTLEGGNFLGSFVSGRNEIVLKLYSDSSGLPDRVIESWDLLDVLTFNIAVVPFQSVLHPTLNGGKQYWLIANMADSASLALWWGPKPADPGRLAESHNGSPFTVSALPRGAFEIDGSSPKHEGAAPVRWDIVSMVFNTLPPNTVKAGGVAEARTIDNFRLKLTGSGTFVSPAGRNGTSGAATGGGTWRLYSPNDVPVANGTYEVTDVLSWQFAGFFTPGVLDDNIGPGGASGNAVLRIEYSDGTRGVLFVACHGPGGPAEISEGVAATKGYMTSIGFSLLYPASTETARVSTLDK